MKQTIFILFILASVNITYAQEESVYTLVKPIAYDKLNLFSPSQKPRQRFIVRVQDTNNELLKVVYFTRPDLLREGGVNFIDPRTLNNKTLWRINPRNPTEKEKFYCNADNFLDKGSKKSDPILRFRATQIDADIMFNNLSEIRCMILDEQFPPTLVNSINQL